MDLNTLECVLTGPVVLDRAAWQPGDASPVGGTWLFLEPQPGVRRLRDLTTPGWLALTGSDAGLDVAATCTLAELCALFGASAFLPLTAAPAGGEQSTLVAAGAFGAGTFAASLVARSILPIGGEVAHVLNLFLGLPIGVR